MIRTSLALLGLAATLAACSGGNETAISQAGQVQNLYQNLRSALRKPEPLPTLTPELVSNLSVSTMELVFENRGSTVYLVPFSDRTDSRPGALRTWRSADDVHFILREGVLVGMRGLDANIGSADVSSTVAAIQTGQPKSGPKRLFVRNGDNGTDRLDLSCRMTSGGVETLDIVGQQVNATKLVEACTFEGQTVTNTYWLAKSGGTVWQSRQWGGPEIGYLRFRLLKQ